MNFHDSWHFLRKHSAFKAKGTKAKGYGSRFREALDIEVVRVNPKSNSIDDDKSKNTATRIWLECGQVEDPMSEKDDLQREFACGQGSDSLEYGILSHDIRLDCGAKTFEKAIIKLAKLVKKHYGEGK